MKVNEILSEAVISDPYKLATNIIDNCKPFLTAINYQVNENTLYRGHSQSANPKLGFKLDPRVNRKTKDTRAEYSKIIDDWFNDKFGVKYRSSGTFATGGKSTAQEYGNVHAIFPIGEFSYCWSPKVSDMTFNLLPYSIDRGNKDPKYSIDEIYKYLTQAKYQTTDLTAGILSCHEIMLYCPNGYYLVSVESASYKTIIHLIQNKDSLNNISEVESLLHKTTNEVAELSNIVAELKTMLNIFSGTYEEYYILDAESKFALNVAVRAAVKKSKYSGALKDVTTYVSLFREFTQSSDKLKQSMQLQRRLAATLKRLRQ